MSIDLARIKDTSKAIAQAQVKEARSPKLKQGRGRFIIDKTYWLTPDDKPALIGCFMDVRITASESLPNAVDEKGVKEEANPVGSTAVIKIWIDKGSPDWQRKNQAGKIAKLFEGIAGGALTDVERQEMTDVDWADQGARGRELTYYRSVETSSKGASYIGDTWQLVSDAPEVVAANIALLDGKTAAAA